MEADQLPAADAGQLPATRRARLRRAAAARGVPLPTILVTVAVVAVTYLAGQLAYRLRDVLLLMVVAGFIALILNPFVVFVQRRIPRRGPAVAVVTIWALLVFIGLAATGVPFPLLWANLARRPAGIAPANITRGIPVLPARDGRMKLPVLRRASCC